MAANNELVSVLYKQACTDNNIDGAKHFIEGDVGKRGGRERRHGTLEALLRQVTPDTSEDGVAVAACSRASSNGGKTRDLTELDVFEQYLLLDFLCETCENDVAHVLYAATMPEKEAAADKTGSTVNEVEGLSAKKASFKT